MHLEEIMRAIIEPNHVEPEGRDRHLECGDVHPFKDQVSPWEESDDEEEGN